MRQKSRLSVTVSQPANESAGSATTASAPGAAVDRVGLAVARRDHVVAVAAGERRARSAATASRRAAADGSRAAAGARQSTRRAADRVAPPSASISSPPTVPVRISPPSVPVCALEQAASVTSQATSGVARVGVDRVGPGAAVDRVGLPPCEATSSTPPHRRLPAPGAIVSSGPGVDRVGAVAAAIDVGARLAVEAVVAAERR